MQVEPRMRNNRSSKQTQISEEIRQAVSLALCAFFTFLFSLPCDSTFLLGPRDGDFPFSHMNIHKRHRHTEHTAGLFVGDFWCSLPLSCSALTQLQKTKAFHKAPFICLSGQQGWTGSFYHLTYNTVRAENWACYRVNRAFDSPSSHLCSSVVTHCLGRLPLKQTTKTHCKELTPY